MSSGKALGYVLPAASIGLGALLIRPRRGFFPFNDEGESLAPIVAQAYIEERHYDQIEITEHPVEQGASIADHAFKRPAEVIVKWGWSNSPSGPGSLIGQALGLGAAVVGQPLGQLASLPATIRAAQSLFTGNDQNQVKQIYQTLLQLQADRIPFDLFTGKRAYTNMLLYALSVDTDQNTENSMIVTAVCRQIIIVTTQVVPLLGNSNTQAEPAVTAPTQDQGPQQLQPAPTFTPQSNSLDGSLNNLQTDLANIQGNIGSTENGAALDAVAGPLSQLNGSIGSALDATVTAREALPAPFEVPTVPASQTMTVSLQGRDLSGVALDALDALPERLEATKSTINAAIRQLPSVQGALPASMSGLLDQLKGAQGTIDNALKQVNRVIH